MPAESTYRGREDSQFPGAAFSGSSDGSWGGAHRVTKAYVPRPRRFGFKFEFGFGFGFGFGFRLEARFRFSIFKYWDFNPDSDWG